MKDKVQKRFCQGCGPYICLWCNNIYKSYITTKHFMQTSDYGIYCKKFYWPRRRICWNFLMFLYLVWRFVVACNFFLKLQSCNSCNNKHMMTLIQISNTETFAFKVILVFELLSRKVLFINKKDNRNYLKSRQLFKKIASFTGKLLQNKESHWFQVSTTKILGD